MAQRPQRVRLRRSSRRVSPRRLDGKPEVAAIGAGAVEPRAMITETIALDALLATFEALRPNTQCKMMVDPGATRAPSDTLRS
jgi:hypothetical protein